MTVTLEPHEQELLLSLMELRLQNLKAHPTDWFDSLDQYETRRAQALIEKLKAGAVVPK